MKKIVSVIFVCLCPYFASAQTSVTTLEKSERDWTTGVSSPSFGLGTSPELDSYVSEFRISVGIYV